MVEVAKYGDGTDMLTPDMIDGYAVVFQRAQNSLAGLRGQCMMQRYDLRDGIYPWHPHPLVLAQWKHHRFSAQVAQSHLYGAIVEHEHPAYSYGTFVSRFAPCL